MSQETLEWLNRNVLRGFTDKRGHAWHHTLSLQGAESNHYPGAIPVADVRRRLFGFEMAPTPVWTRDMLTGELAEIPGELAWQRSDMSVRDGSVMGIHTDGYKGHQYAEWLVRNVEVILSDDLQVASAGLLKGGAVAWVQVEMPDNVETPEGVTFRPFLMATTSFDGSIATTYKRGFTDVVCDNTREMFLREAGETVRVKHTSKSDLRISEVRRDLGIIFQMAEDITREIAALCAVDVSDKQWGAFVEAHVPITEESTARAVTMAENKRGELTRLWNTDTRVAPWRGTAWGAIQAVNTYGQHLSIVRNVNRVERNYMSAVQGKIGESDRQALATLETVLGRELVTV